MAKHLKTRTKVPQTIIKHTVHVTKHTLHSFVPWRRRWRWRWRWWHETFEELLQMNDIVGHTTIEEIIVPLIEKDRWKRWLMIDGLRRWMNNNNKILLLRLHHHRRRRRRRRRCRLLVVVVVMLLVVVLIVKGDIASIVILVDQLSNKGNVQTLLTCSTIDDHYQHFTLPILLESNKSLF